MAEETPIFDEDVFRRKWTARLRAAVPPALAQSWERMEDASSRVHMVDEGMTVDPRVYYRIIGSRAVSDLRSTGVLKGGLDILPDEGISMKGVPHFSGGTPDWNYASRLLDWGEYPYIVGIRGSDARPSFENPNLRGQDLRFQHAGKPGRFDPKIKTRQIGDVVGGRFFQSELRPLGERPFPVEMSGRNLSAYMLADTAVTERVPVINRELWEAAKGRTKFPDFVRSPMMDEAGNIPIKLNLDDLPMVSRSTMTPHATDIPLDGRPYVVWKIPSMRRRWAQQYGGQAEGKPVEVVEARNNMSPEGREYIPTGRANKDDMMAAREELTRLLKERGIKDADNLEVSLKRVYSENRNSTKPENQLSIFKEVVNKFGKLSGILEESHPMHNLFKRGYGFSVNAAGNASPVFDVHRYMKGGFDINTGQTYYPSELTEIDGVHIPNERIDELMKYHPKNAAKYPEITDNQRYKVHPAWFDEDPAITKKKADEKFKKETGAKGPVPMTTPTPSVSINIDTNSDIGAFLFS